MDVRACFHAHVMSVNRDPAPDEYDSFLNDVVNSIYEDKEIGRLAAAK